ncbi:hypothetical protein [Gordonia sp. NPDC003376]
MAVAKTNRIRVAGGAAALIAAGALSVAMAAPAAAGVTALKITTPSGYGSTAGVYGASCSYDVSATISQVDPGKPVTFKAEVGGVVDSTKTIEPKAGAANAVTWAWVPSKPGSYTITATQDGSSQQAKATVANGTQLPSWFWGGACLVTG